MMRRLGQGARASQTTLRSHRLLSRQGQFSTEIQPRDYYLAVQQKMH
jgi:hypothetical protein